MDPKRRLLLKGVLASGAGSLFLGGSGVVQAALNTNNESVILGAAPVETCLLTSKAAVESSFGAGVKAGLSKGSEFISIRTDRTDALTHVKQILKSGRKIKLIGMVDDAIGELLVAQARSVGAEVSWLGQHSAEMSQTRHHIINNETAQLGALALGKALKRSAASHMMKAEQPFSTARDLELSSQRTGVASADWAAQLGHALARSDSQSDTHFSPARGERLEGRFVSFVIEV